MNDTSTTASTAPSSQHNARHYTHRGLKGDLAAFLHSHPGEEIFLDDLVERFTPGEPSTLVRNAMAYVVSVDQDIHAVVKARSWAYRPVDNHRLYQEIHTTADGTVLVESEDGQLFKLVSIAV